MYKFFPHRKPRQPENLTMKNTDHLKNSLQLRSFQWTLGDVIGRQSQGAVPSPNTDWDTDILFLHKDGALKPNSM